MESRIDSARYGMCDPLTGDGRHVYLSDQQIDPRTGEMTALDFGHGQSKRGAAALRYPQDIHYLRGGKTGILEYSWTERAMALRKAQSTLTWGSADGEQLAYADERDQEDLARAACLRNPSFKQVAYPRVAVKCAFKKASKCLERRRRSYTYPYTCSHT